MALYKIVIIAMQTDGGHFQHCIRWKFRVCTEIYIKNLYQDFIALIITYYLTKYIQIRDRLRISTCISKSQRVSERLTVLWEVYCNLGKKITETFKLKISKVELNTKTSMNVCYKLTKMHAKPKNSNVLKAYIFNIYYFAITGYNLVIAALYHNSSYFRSSL